MTEAQIVSAHQLPRDLMLGDTAFPCFHLAKLRHEPPQQVATRLAHDISDQVSHSRFIEKVEPIGGYVNFRFKMEPFAEAVIGEVLQQKSNYGKSTIGLGKTICIDYSSPNIAKMFHVGHLRSTLIGAALLRVFKHLGYATVGINHLGDWGTQFGKLLVAYRMWGDEQLLQSQPVEYLYKLYVRFHAETAQNPRLEDDAREAFKALEHGDESARSLWQKFRDYSLEEFNRIYNLLGVTFDSTVGEAFYEDKMGQVLDSLAQKNLSVTSRDALIVDLSDIDLPPVLLRKKDEATLYATRDLAAAIYRHETYGFHKLLYVVGQAQELHFKQLFEVLRRMGHSWAKDCEHIMFGWVKFHDKHLSSREGNVVLLDEVLNRSVELVDSIIAEKNPELPDRTDVARTVGVGAVVFADLAPRRIKDVNFDWADVLSFDYGSGPYVMYTHARLSSILRKYGAPVPETVRYELLSYPDERAVVHKLEGFPRQLFAVADKSEPSYLCSYLVELCGVINGYLQKGAKDTSLRVLCEDPELSASRVALVEASRQVIQTGLTILGIGAPEQM
jgi:arginyl-tRNA synthetase